ncbi:MAG: hypothetical protein AAF809_06840 [Bacteroidota bacterium]
MARLRLAALAAVLLGGALVCLMVAAPPDAPPLMSATVAAPVAMASTAGEGEESAPAIEDQATAPFASEAPRVTQPTVPTPLWLDAPYAALDLAPRAQVVQGEAPLPPVFDRATFDALGLDAWISMREMRGDLQHAVGGAHRFRVPVDAEAEIRTTYLLPPLDTLAGRAQRTPESTTRHRHGLHLSPGDSVWGRGTLLVEGDLVVEDGAQLRWDGLVLIHTNGAPHQLRVELGGRVQIRGALAVRQVVSEAHAWRAVLADEMDAGLRIALGNEALLYYDQGSLRAALATLLG